jgi:hypothetical protein
MPHDAFVAVREEPVAQTLEVTGSIAEDLVAVADEGVCGKVLGVAVDLRSDEFVGAIGEP